jgi:hypothetical protein
MVRRRGGVPEVNPVSSRWEVHGAIGNVDVGGRNHEAVSKQELVCDCVPENEKSMKQIEEKESVKSRVYLLSESS